MNKPVVADRGGRRPTIGQLLEAGRLGEFRHLVVGITCLPFIDLTPLRPDAAYCHPAAIHECPSEWPLTEVGSRGRGRGPTSPHGQIRRRAWPLPCPFFARSIDQSDTVCLVRARAAAAGALALRACPATQTQTMNQLDQLQACTVVVADTGNSNSWRSLRRDDKPPIPP